MASLVRCLFLALFGGQVLALGSFERLLDMFEGLRSLPLGSFKQFKRSKVLVLGPLENSFQGLLEAPRSGILQSFYINFALILYWLCINLH